MTIRRRSIVLGSLCLAGLVLYGAAKYYSPSLVLYVVEQSLLQKAPPGISSDSVHARFQTAISAAPDKNSRMERLLRISEYLEKVQHLDLEQLNQLLTIEPDRPGISRFSPVFWKLPVG